MKLSLERKICGAQCTIGELFVDGQFECYTLEDRLRGTDPSTVNEWKVPGSTAIPPGTYDIFINFSEHFQRDLPFLVAVPGFEGIRIHPGNTQFDTEGCILVGRTRGNNFVGESKAAFAALFQKIKDALDAGDTVKIEVA